MPVTIADVAARAGVSKTTVSRVINGKGELDEATAARIRALIAEMGYVPSARAVGLARGRTRIVGMLLPSLNWPWMGEVLQGAVEVVESQGYGLLVFTFTRGAQSLQHFATQVSAQSFDGLVVVEPEGTLDYITTLRDQGLPVVLIDDRGQAPRFPSVHTTNHAGAQAAAEHLLDLGRRRPLVIAGSTRFGCVQERLTGFADGYARAGVRLDPALLLEGDFTHESGQQLAQRAVTDNLEFDAVFAHNDVMAIAAMQVLRRAGRRIPDDVAVIGFDDLPMAAQSDPPLTAVRQPVREMGAAAARALLAHLGGTPLPETPAVLPTTLTVRASTRS